MLNFTYNKEIKISDTEKKEVGYTRLTVLLQSENLSQMYRTVRRAIILEGEFVIKNITIKKIPLIHQKNNKKVTNQ